MWINSNGEKFWVKYHFITDQGVESLTQAQADELVKLDTDHTPATCSRRSIVASTRPGR
jgi:catalase